MPDVDTTALLTRIWPNGVPVGEVQLANRITEALAELALHDVSRAFAAQDAVKPPPSPRVSRLPRRLKPHLARDIDEQRRVLKRLVQEHPRASAKTLGKMMGVGTWPVYQRLREMGLPPPRRMKARGVLPPTPRVRGGAPSARPARYSSRGELTTSITEALSTGPATSADVAVALNRPLKIVSAVLSDRFRAGALMRDNIAESGPPVYRYRLKAAA